MSTVSTMSCFQIDKSFLYNVSALRHMSPMPVCCEHSPILYSAALAHSSAHLCRASEISKSPRVSKESKYHYKIFFGNVLMMFPLSYKEIKKLTKTH